MFEPWNPWMAQDEREKRVDSVRDLKLRREWEVLTAEKWLAMNVLLDLSKHFDSILTALDYCEHDRGVSFREEIMAVERAYKLLQREPDA